MNILNKIKNIHIKVILSVLPIFAVIYSIYYYFWISMFDIALIIISITIIIVVIANYNRHKTENDKDNFDINPYFKMIENSKNKDDLPEFCLLFQELPKNFEKDLCFEYGSNLLIAIMIIVEINQNFFDYFGYFDYWKLFLICCLIYIGFNKAKMTYDKLTLLKHYKKQIKVPHLEFNHQTIIYFDGIDEYAVEWQNIDGFDTIVHEKYKKHSIVVNVGKDKFSIISHYIPDDIDGNIFTALKDYHHIIKYNRKRLKIT